ncbi:MAG: hypothetical protein JWN69_891 [Alphaproteobacteria bacterium]|nr:hypothetical protein [Alphaproteobacteria bacterium]
MKPIGRRLAAAIVLITCLPATAYAYQATPRVTVVKPDPTAPPVAIVEPPDPSDPQVAIVPPPAPGAPPAVAVIPPDPKLPAAVIVPPPGAVVDVAVAAVGPAPSDYPPCSATRTDRCIQSGAFGKHMRARRSQ